MVLLPGCPCCGSGCPCPEGEELPDRITVALSNITKKVERVSNLLSLSFSAPFGSGASGTASGTGGDPRTAGGPIASVSLTNGGSGYAIVNRAAPTLTASGGSGTGASMTVTLAQSKNGIGLDYWSVSAVSMSGGTGYIEGDQVAFSVAEGDTEHEPASATIHTGRSPPTLSASATGGTGATFSIDYTKNSHAPETWSISGISVTHGGTGYSGGASLSISPGKNDVEVYGAYAYITTSRTQPTLSASVSGTGYGASLSVSLSSGYGDEYGPTWTVSSIGITDGGSGYSEWDQVTVSVTDGQQSYWGYFDAYVTGVDASGAITAITIYYGGDYYKDGGVVTGVSLYGGGEYYKDNGIPASVTVESGGNYYRENNGGPPYVAPVTVSVVQKNPSTGSGAVISATVDDNPNSANFGKIVSLSLDEGGSGYLDWSYLFSDCDVKMLNGRSIGMGRIPGVPPFENCTYGRCFAGGRIYVVYRGQSTPPMVGVFADCAITLTADEADAPFGCDDLSFTATDILGGTAVVSKGPATTDPSCQEIYEASLIDVTLSGEDAVELYSRPSDPSWPCCEDGCSFARKTTGSHYNGTFSCAFKSMIGTSRYYEYELDELCGHTRTIGVVVGHPSTPGLSVLLTNVVCYVSHNYYGPGVPDFGCGPSGRSCLGFPEMRHATISIGGQTSCPCDLESLTGGSSALAGGESGFDGQIEGGFYGRHRVGIDGDPVIRFIKAEIGG